MSADDARADHDELQFDRVESTDAPGSAVTESPAVTCVVCGKSVGAEYYHVNGKPVCENCRHVVTSAAQTPRTAGPLVRAGLFGLLAAVAGAAIYYAVIAITNFEIGLVAILIGYMVGYMVRKGARGRGGRRFQILAVVLTYWAVGLAYTPLAFKGAGDDEKSEQADTIAPDSARSTVGDSAAIAATSDRPQMPASTSPDSARAADADGDETPSGGSVLKAFGLLFALVFALPVIYIAQSMPGGLLSALIIFIGLRQAWSMTAGHTLEISGPYKVGDGPAAAPAAE
jgi:Flp pilus assembly protein TadB